MKNAHSLVVNFVVFRREDELYSSYSTILILSPSRFFSGVRRLVSFSRALSAYSSCRKAKAFLVALGESCHPGRGEHWPHLAEKGVLEGAGLFLPALLCFELTKKADEKSGERR